MGHTNQTANYNLPQFVGTDKPSWLGDINDAFNAIDLAIAAAASEASTADGKADALGTTVSGHTTQIGTLQNTVTSQGNTLNTVTALIGNGTPTTTDHTIIGAINELHADQGDLANLQTTDKSSLVAAINEVAGGGGGNALQFETKQLSDTIPANGKKIIAVGENVPTGYEIASVTVVNTGDSDITITLIESGSALSIQGFSKSASSLPITADVYLVYKPQ